VAKRKPKAEPGFACYRDFNSRTAIRVAEHEGMVSFIPMDLEEGFQVHETSVEAFSKRFKVMDDYPVERGCQLFLNYARTIGATTEALDYLGQIITIPKEDYDTATAKQKAKATAPKAKTKAKAAPKKAAVKKAPVAKKAAAKKGASGKYPSAAQMFQELIMAGKLTDEKIFEQVQKEFNLDDSKRSYVKWYRNHLRKNGENPPEAK